jgi:hypothetical protein
VVERFDLLTPLTRAYGSADRARSALDRALRRAGLDQVPVAVAELTGFVCAQLHAIVAEDMGPMIAGALLSHLRNQLGLADEGVPVSSTTRPVARVTLRAQTPPESQPRSGPRRKAPWVMLVRVKRGDEEESLGLAALDVQVIRVTHPLPACERMRVLRPSVVVAGPGIGDEDLDRLMEAARAIGTQVIALAAFVGPAAVRAALRRAIDRATAAEDADLPDSKPGGQGTGKT